MYIGCISRDCQEFKPRGITLAATFAILLKLVIAPIDAHGTGLPIDTRWVGTPPICGASYADCPDGWSSVTSSALGAGPPCLIGHKVLCASLPGKSHNYFNFRWIGSAPICRPSQTDDCLIPGGTVFGFDQAGDGALCLGTPKMLCGFPKFFRYQWLGTAPFCLGSYEADCKALNGEVVETDVSGDGALCNFGHKVLCRLDDFERTDVVLNDGSYHSLDECPLQNALGTGYASLRAVIKDGRIVDRATGKNFTSLKHVKDLTLKASLLTACQSDPVTLYVMSLSQELWLVDVCSKNRFLPVLKNGSYSVYQIPNQVPFDEKGCRVKNQPLKVVHSLIIGNYGNLQDFYTATIRGEVLGAGEIDVEDGEIQSINNSSGHYQPSLKMLLQTMYLLGQQGLEIKEFKNTPPPQDLYVIYKGANSDQRLWLAQTPDPDYSLGDAWNHDEMKLLSGPGLDLDTVDTPAAISFQNKAYIFYRTSDDRIFVAQPTNSGSFGKASWQKYSLDPVLNPQGNPPVNVSIRTSAAPAVVVLKSLLPAILFKGAGSDTAIYAAQLGGDENKRTVQDAKFWGTRSLSSSIRTSAAPAAVVFNRVLYMFYKGSDAGHDTHIYIARSSGDALTGTWSSIELNPKINTSAAPGTVVFRGVLYMFYKGSGNDTNIYIARSTGDLFDGSAWKYDRLNPGINTISAPRPVVIGDSLYLVYRGSGGDTKIWIAQPPALPLGNDDLLNVQGNDWKWQPLNSQINSSTAPWAGVLPSGNGQ